MSISSLVMHPTDRCVFCHFLDGRFRYTILAQDETTAMFVTREQRGIGHVLVVPKAHRETIIDLEPAEGAAIMAAVISVSRAVLDAYQCEGLAVWQNNGSAAHQRVPHVHFHVAGTLPGGGTNFDKVPFLSVEDTDAIADKIRPFLRPPGHAADAGEPGDLAGLA
jgi:histidine triad (HIT) family protein